MYAELQDRYTSRRSGVSEGELSQLCFELFHKIFEVALSLTAVPKWPYFITLSCFEIPKILLAKYPFAAIRNWRIGIIFLSVVRHRCDVVLFRLSCNTIPISLDR